METIALEASREVGFEPRTYSSFLQHKKIREHVDFISELDESGLNLSTTERYLYELDVDRDVINLLDDDPETVLKQNRTKNRTTRR